MVPYKWFGVLGILLLLFLGHGDQKRGGLPLSGMVVVIDPGHGGSDPGARAAYGNHALLMEDEYCYDVALRLSQAVQRLGGVASLTVSDPVQKTPSNLPPNQVIPADQGELFWDGSPAKAGAEGLKKRAGAAVLAAERYKGRKVVFLSIHFDRLGKDTLEGIHLIAPPGRIPELCTFLLAEMQREGRLFRRDGQVSLALKQSGDQKTGSKNIYVLNNNPIPQRCLVELGNFDNPKDHWRIRDPKVRDAYAALIARALAKLNASKAGE